MVRNESRTLLLGCFRAHDARANSTPQLQSSAPIDLCARYQASGWIRSLYRAPQQDRACNLSGTCPEARTGAPRDTDMCHALSDYQLLGGSRPSSVDAERHQHFDGPCSDCMKHGSWNWMCWAQVAFHVNAEWMKSSQARCVAPYCLVLRFLLLDNGRRHQLMERCMPQVVGHS